MTTIKANVADHLSQIEALTNTNLQILKTINDSFFTKKNHLFTEVDDTTYVIPSFISLENKINMLQENFENLVKAPETCEAYFNFDGNTRAIEVRKYNHVPDAITIPVVSTYDVESNDIFKDFMTPVPYINIEMPSLPNDIVEVNVKKIVAKSDALKALFKSKLSYTANDDRGNATTLYHSSVNESYGNIYKMLLNSKEDVDYIEYDTIYKLPIRKNIGTGTYIIESVLSDVIDDDLNELITLKLRGKLTYKLFNDTIEKPLQVGDELINFDGTGKVVITDIRTATNVITVKVVNGEYLNFIGVDSYDTNNDTDIHALSKLRFYSAYDFEADKYIKIPLEEDQYVFIAVAPLNSRMNVQGSWGTGIILDAYSLVKDDIRFNTYYNANVKNIGDVLFEMTSMMTSPITALSEDTFTALTSVKPKLDVNTVSVMQINKHLNNSTTIKNIRDAYNQKKTAEKSLEEVQTKINDINAKLSYIVFDDVVGTRASYTAQLSTLNSQKNELMTVISNAIETISLNANSSEIPIENAKYHIRGFYVPAIAVNNTDYSNNVIGLQVQYRYKNMSSEVGNATSINSTDGNKTYIYSDWNNMTSHNRAKTVKCEDGVYKYYYELPNEDKNEPSYNQIDIPISQGETVDIRVKVLYDFGQPYVNMTSDWSDIINVSFPEEFTKDLPILSIIEENNNDIETNRFNGILKTAGVEAHLSDVLIDNNITYYHKPDSIASGFYTEERKIIPLKDKLFSMSNDIALLKQDINETKGNYVVNVLLGDNVTSVYSDRDNNIVLEAYNSFNNIENNNLDGVYTFKDGVVSTMLNLSITNTGTTALKLYSVFPGSRTVKLNDTTATLFKKDDYCLGQNEGVWFKYQYGSDESMLQTQNQFITFRVRDVWTGDMHYKSNSGTDHQNVQNATKIDALKESNELGMVIYPRVSTKYGLCIDSDDTRSYMIVNPGEEIIIPMFCSFVATKPNTSIKKTISFDLRTSLYSDPINYSFTVIGKNTTSIQDQLTTANKLRVWDILKGINNKYNVTVK